MTGSIKRIGAIFIKELQDFKSNMNILIMYVIPILLVYIYGNLIPNLPKGFALAFGLLFLVVMVGVYVPAMIIAEEKEKKTLEVLLLSPATPIEVFIGKGLLTFATMVISLFIIIMAAGGGWDHLGVILIGALLCAIFCILLGIIVGLLSQNQMATGIVGTPIYMLLLLVPLLAVTGATAVEKIAKVLPTYHFFRMLEMALPIDGTAKTLGDMWPQIGFLVGSIVVALATLVLVYRKKRLN